MGWQAVDFDDAAKERIKQAAAFEKRLRLESFLNLPSQCGKFTLRIPTIRDMLELEFVENRFFDDAVPQIDDYIHLLWKLRTDDEKRNERDFAKYVATHLTDDERMEIAAFFSAQFNDMPSGSSGNVDPYDSAVCLASLVDTLCSEYGWTLDQTLDTSLQVALQLTQRIIKRHNPKYAIRNGITQRAKAQEMNQHG